MADAQEGADDVGLAHVEVTAIQSAGMCFVLHVKYLARTEKSQK